MYPHNLPMADYAIGLDEPQAHPNVFTPIPRVWASIDLAIDDSIATAILS